MAALPISAISVSGDFAQTSDCTSTLQAGTGCTVRVSFTPTATGTRTGTLAIVTDIAVRPDVVALIGTGASLPRR